MSLASGAGSLRNTHKSTHFLPQSGATWLSATQSQGGEERCLGVAGRLVQPHAETQQQTKQSSGPGTPGRISNESLPKGSELSKGSLSAAFTFLLFLFFFFCPNDDEYTTASRCGKKPNPTCRIFHHRRRREKKNCSGAGFILSRAVYQHSGIIGNMSDDSLS